jgi:glycosyltransferase involved in cell wall biosynthesis
MSAADDPPTILQILPSLETGGVERGTIEMTHAIVAAGGRALVASAGGRLVPQVERAGGRHIVLPLMTKDPVNILVNSFSIGRLIKRSQVRLVHARSRAPAWSAWMAARRANVPFVTTWHGVYSEGFPGKHSYNAIMARGERVIAISHYVASVLEARYRVDPRRVRIIPRGVDPAIFSPEVTGGDRVHRLAQAWRLPPGAPVVMLPARLTRWKGAELLLEAASGLSRHGFDDMFVVFVGGDQGRVEYRRQLEQRAERLGLAGRVRLVGNCDDMPAALMLADVVVCPSLKPEPFGRAVVEAQAMERPVIAANHGGAAETVFDGETGWRVTPGDAGALGEVIAHVLRLSADERAALGARARASVLTQFTTAAMQQATLNVYGEVLR